MGVNWESGNLHYITDRGLARRLKKGDHVGLKNILDKLYKTYDIEYNVHLKILYIHKPILVSDFRLLKVLLKGKDIKDIRVEPRYNIMRW